MYLITQINPPLFNTETSLRQSLLKLNCRHPDFSPLIKDKKPLKNAHKLSIATSIKAQKLPKNFKIYFILRKRLRKQLQLQQTFINIPMLNQSYNFILRFAFTKRLLHEEGIIYLYGVLCRILFINQFTGNCVSQLILVH